jgi:dTMP kinase
MPALPGFIVLEGIDGSGTTTQCVALATALRSRGHRVHETREPSRGEIGLLARRQLGVATGTAGPETLALLFAADRLDHVEQEIRPALAGGGLVVCDRYVLSSWAYQGLECDEAWVRAINGRAPWPALTLWLEVPAPVALARVQARAGTAERFDALPLQEAIAARYARLCGEAEDVVRVDGTAPTDAVTAVLVAACVARLGL